MFVLYMAIVLLWKICGITRYRFRLRMIVPPYLSRIPATSVLAHLVAKDEDPIIGPIGSPVQEDNHNAENGNQALLQIHSMVVNTFV